MTKDGYYTSGEFAKKANVTLRTIRYYDRQGILKPSKVADNGYRLYTVPILPNYKRFCH